MAIRGVHAASRQTYGTRRGAQGFEAGRDRVDRLRRTMTLRCRQKRGFRVTTNSEHTLPVADNLLQQNFTASAPGQLWLTDITYIRTDEGWLYLAGIKDMYTREIVGCAMDERMTQQLCLRALGHAHARRRPPPGLIHHSDRGSQYCARDYRHTLDALGMRASMSRRGNCYDNAPMESFWGSLKNELVHHRRFSACAAGSSPSAGARPGSARSR